MDQIPYGYCQCGCGRKTSLAASSCAKRGLVRGEPRRFCVGHAGHAPPPPPIPEDRGYETPCLIWQGVINPRTGYGQVHVVRDSKASTTSAHRFIYEQAFGSVAADVEIDHLCKQRDCVNLGHLEAVSPAVNVRRSSRAKLTPAQVDEILASPLTGRELSRRYGVGESQISMIRSGKSWGACSRRKLA